VTRLNRRQFLAAGGGAIGAAASGVLLDGYVWPLLEKEDLISGTPPEIKLQPNAWTTTKRRVRFAAIGDNGSGGRQAMAVAKRLAETYRHLPFGLVALLGDISYYGNFEERYDEVFAKPMAPLIDAGVGFELAIGNHDNDLRYSDEGLKEIEAELRLLGTPGRYYTTTHGPVDFFSLDSSVPGAFGPGASTQWEWLDDSLASSPTSGRSSRCTTRSTRLDNTARPCRRANGWNRSSSATTSTSSSPATTTTTNAHIPRMGSPTW
jgi:Calcineurin-like phosphoesterase